MDGIKEYYENLTYEHAKDILRENLDAMKNNFIAAGYYMKYIRDNEMYLADGYGSIWEFAEDNYGIRKSTASRWMAMNDKFSQGGNSPVLAAEYRGFEKSQLQEMLYLDDKQIQAVAPDMTVKEIREARKPETPERELKKPDETDQEYLKAAARNLITRWRDWFLEDYMNRVMKVDKSPGEIKKKLGKNGRWRPFLTDVGAASMDLFDDYVQIWDEKGECLGDFDWFHLAAAIQGMWNVVAIEKAQEAQESGEKRRVSPIDKGCVTGKNPNGNCVCCGKDGVECCAQCDDNCNGRCGWIDSAVATSQQEESEPDRAQDQESEHGRNQDAGLPEERQVTGEEVEIIDAEIVEDDGGMEDGKYLELSDKTDQQILHDLLDGAKEMLSAIRELYADEDIRTRKHRLMVAAYAGMIADLDVDDLPEHTQPDLPDLKNNDQRKEWLRNYESWGLWYEDKNIGARYYKYDFKNGARLIAEEYTRPATEWYGEHITSYLHLVGGPEPPKKDCISKWQRHEVYNRHPNSETELIEFLKYVQKEGKARC